MEREKLDSSTNATKATVRAHTGSVAAGCSLALQTLSLQNHQTHLSHTHTHTHTHTHSHPDAGHTPPSAIAPGLSLSLSISEATHTHTHTRTQPLFQTPRTPGVNQWPPCMDFIYSFGLFVFTKVPLSPYLLKLYIFFQLFLFYSLHARTHSLTFIKYFFKEL